MYQNVKRTCRVLFWLINPIVLWRSRGRRRRRCLRSLISTGERLEVTRNLIGCGTQGHSHCNFP